jgi:hypothetical protein
MKPAAVRTACLAAVFVLGVCLIGGPVGGADSPPALVSDAEFAAVGEHSTREIRAALEGKPGRRAAERGRVAAVMLAAYAQQDLTGKEASRRATVRDAALRTADLIKEAEYGKAAEQAAALPKLAADAKAKREPVKLFGAYLDVEELMSQFRAPKPGDADLESRLEKLAGAPEGVVTADALAALRQTAVQCAVAAELSQMHVPAPENAAAWRRLGDDMRKAAVAVAAAAQAKDGKAAFIAVGRLNTSCRDCHKQFR